MKILYDTREHKGFEWSFGEYEREERKLETGDYTLEGYENIICLERKKSPAELAMNIGVDFKRFSKELEKMKKIEYSYIICEFSLADALNFPLGSDIPKSTLSKIKIGGKFLVKTLSSYKDKYGIDVIYCGNRENAIEKAIELFSLILKIKGK
jgi:hypothetical protein